MSAKTVHNPALHLSVATREAIKECGISLSDYASNIEDKLRMRGEHELANRMLSEIQLAIDSEREF